MFKNLKIIGTSHIAKDSVKQIEQEFLDFKPDIMAVELDTKRYNSLLFEKNNKISLNLVKKVGFTGFMFLIIGRFVQKKLGSIVGVEPGSDMKTAVELAKKNNKKITLIDRDIDITLKRFSKKFSFKEKMRLLKDLLFGFYSKKKISINLSKVPDQKLISFLITELKERYPSIYLVLIEERNKFMAKKLFFMMKQDSNAKILCVVGAGHEEGLMSELKKLYYSNISLVPEK
ncbi:MAG: TraB family protein [Nanoarchaeota archaeon]|nr:TraB family protein [Nanoarchaeota archaeon]MBU1269834.1 TraB family protein [Nanoarchaeota archaeon]MBU2442669.1 TraB family protein [Nanoarchaeota archaeon]